MKKTIITLTAILFSLGSSANTTTFKIKTHNTDEACKVLDIEEFKGVEANYIKKLNEGLVKHNLEKVQVESCTVLKEAEVVREATRRRGQFKPAIKRKGVIELELSYGKDLKDCENIIERELFFGGVKVITTQENLDILDELGIVFVEDYLPGLGYREVVVRAPVCKK